MICKISLLWGGLMNGLLYLGIAVVVLFAWEFIKACKDPDVKAASKLGMSVTRFRLYKRLTDENNAIIKQYGFHSSEAGEHFRKVLWPQIKNPNEWRRYQEYRSEITSIEEILELHEFLWTKELKNKNS